MKRSGNGVAVILIMVLFSVSFSSCRSSYVASRPSQPVYVRPAPPSSRYIWVDDTWVWRGGRYEYQHGYWTLPRPNRVWVDGSWQARGNRYYWNPGKWKRSNRR